MLKTSKDVTLREQQELAELYYKGVDIVVGGSDWSERLTLRNITNMKDMSKNIS